MATTIQSLQFISALTPNSVGEMDHVSSEDPERELINTIQGVENEVADIMKGFESHRKKTKQQKVVFGSIGKHPFNETTPSPEGKSDEESSIKTESTSELSDYQDELLNVLNRIDSSKSKDPSFSFKFGDNHPTFENAINSTLQVNEFQGEVETALSHMSVFNRNSQNSYHFGNGIIGEESNAKDTSEKSVSNPRKKFYPQSKKPARVKEQEDNLKLAMHTKTKKEKSKRWEFFTTERKNTERKRNIEAVQEEALKKVTEARKGGASCSDFLVKQFYS
jgi:hypothetical protein